MFATMILQLPTEDGYTGGELVVKHYNSEEKFDYHTVSSLGFCYTAFFADCMHALQTTEPGTRSCLVFNLVRRDPASEPVQPKYSSDKIGKIELALEPWLNEVTDGKLNVFGNLLAIPLQHKYRKRNLSFSALKGDYSIAAEVLRNCRDNNKMKWLDLRLCLASKYQCSGDEDEENINIEKWVGLDDKVAVAFKTPKFVNV